MIDSLLKYILLYEFSNDLDAQSDFDKKIVSKMPVKQNHSYLKYALDRNKNIPQMSNFDMNTILAGFHWSYPQ